MAPPKGFDSFSAILDIVAERLGIRAKLLEQRLRRDSLTRFVRGEPTERDWTKLRNRQDCPFVELKWIAAEDAGAQVL